MKSFLPYVPLLVLAAIVLLIAARPKKGGSVRIKHGVGTLLAILGVLSLVSEFFIEPAMGHAHVDIFSVMFACIFVAIGMYLARTPKQAAPSADSTKNEP